MRQALRIASTSGGQPADESLDRVADIGGRVSIIATRIGLLRRLAAFALAEIPPKPSSPQR
jgi:hypothetical protein